MKTCNTCKIIKSQNEFAKNPNGKDGLRSKCKLCDQRYYQANFDKIKTRMSVYYNANKPIITEQKKQYNKINAVNIANHKVSYRRENADIIAKQYCIYRKKRYKTDINFKLANMLRSRLKHAIKNCQKSGSAVSDLGCSIEEFKIYMESKFLPGMTWENHGLKGWHIDHIIPLSSFDLSNREEFLRACHYTNLQPLWAKDNFKKRDHIL